MMLALLYGVSFSLSALLARESNKSFAAVLPLFICGVLISFSRQTFITGDLPVYAEGFLDDSWSLYYLREAPFWYFGRVLTSVTGSVGVTFFLIDIAIVFLFTRAFSGKLSIQLVVLLFAFPSILGFTNIYRQFIACVVMMLALKHFREGRARGVWLALLACSVHLAFIGVCLSLLATYIIMLQRRRWWLLLVFPIVAAGLITFQRDISLLAIAGGTDSRGDTGFLYVALGFIVHLVCARLLFRQRRLLTLQLGLIVYFIAGAVSLIFAPDSTGTRVMMISIYLCSFLALGVLSEYHYKSRRAINYTFILAGILITPLIISDSAWHLLFGYVID